MSLLNKIILAGSLLACAGAASAASGDDCVDVSEARTVSAFGTQYALLKDNDAYYKLGFRGSGCDALTLATQVEVSADNGRVCAKTSHVTTKRGSCDVMRIEQIDQKAYDRLRRRR